MDEIGLKWFSETGNISINIVEKKLVAHDDGINEMLKLGIAVGFGEAISPLTASVEQRVKPLCQKAIRALHSGVEEEARTPQNLPLFTFLAFVGVAVDCIREGKVEMGMDMLFTSGVIWGEIESKSLWQTDTARGTKVIGGSRNSALETNKRHNTLRDQRFARMVELIPALGIENAARQCEAEGMGGWQGIKRQWDRHKKRDT